MDNVNKIMRTKFKFGSNYVYIEPHFNWWHKMWYRIFFGIKMEDVEENYEYKKF